MVVKLSGSVIDMAVASGAECITVACPMCQASLDLRQQDMQKHSGKRYNMPIVYITQLLGLCLGIPPKELGLNRLMVAPTSVLQSIGAKA